MYLQPKQSLQNARISEGINLQCDIHTTTTGSLACNLVMMMMMMMKLPILPCAEKLELVLSTAPKTWDNTDKDSIISMLQNTHHSMLTSNPLLLNDDNNNCNILSYVGL